MIFLVRMNKEMTPVQSCLDLSVVNNSAFGMINK